MNDRNSFEGAIFIFGAKFTEGIRKNVQLGFFLTVQLLCYALILLNLPGESTISATFIKIAFLLAWQIHLSSGLQYSQLCLWGSVMQENFKIESLT